MRSHADLLLARAAYEYIGQLACDAVLVARDGVELHAHKVVLAAYSDYFARRAEAPEWSDCCALQWISLREVDGSVLKRVVDYLYTGLAPPRLELSQTEAVRLLAAARHLQVSSLINICEEDLRSRSADDILADDVDSRSCTAFGANSESKTQSGHNSKSKVPPGFISDERNKSGGVKILPSVTGCPPDILQSAGDVMAPHPNVSQVIHDILEFDQENSECKANISESHPDGLSPDDSLLSGHSVGCYFKTEGGSDDMLRIDGGIINEPDQKSSTHNARGRKRQAPLKYRYSNDVERMKVSANLFKKGSRGKRMNSFIPELTAKAAENYVKRKSGIVISSISRACQTEGHVIVSEEDHDGSGVKRGKVMKTSAPSGVGTIENKRRARVHQRISKAQRSNSKTSVVSVNAGSDEIKNIIAPSAITGQNSAVESSACSSFEVQSQQQEMQQPNAQGLLCKKADCGLRFKSYILLRRHMRQDHGLNLKKYLRPESYACHEPSCSGVSFVSHLLLRRHASGVHNVIIAKPDDVICSAPGCGLSFKSHLRLRRHVAVAHGGLNILTSLGHECSESGCRLRFKSRLALRKHLINSHGSNTTDVHQWENLMCQEPDCGLTFLRQSSLRQHIIECHAESIDSVLPQQDMFDCQEADCELSFKRHIALRRHMKEVHGRVIMRPVKLEKFSCTEPSCGMIFALLSHLKHHMKETHGQAVDKYQKWVCEEGACAKRFSVFGALRQHMLASHPELRIMCKLCSYSTPMASLMEKHHMTVHGEDKSFTCDQCDKIFPIKYRLKVHKVLIHGVVDPDLKVYRCELEGCRFLTPHHSNLKRHQLTHLDKQFCCEICGNKFKDSRNLKNHTLLKHLNFRPVVCDQCGKSFLHDTALKAHVAAGHGERRFVCDICDKRFTTKCILHNHMWVRHQVRMSARLTTLVCEYCSYTTPWKDNLLKHTLTHTGERDHACTQCERAFATKEGLKGHMQRVHDGRSLRCTSCDYVTGSARQLKHHTRIVHTHPGVKPFQCAYCDYRTTSLNNCQNHIRFRHKGFELSCVKLFDFDSMPAGEMDPLSTEDDPHATFDPEASCDDSLEVG